MGGRRAYADAVSWLKAARPARIDSVGFAGRCFGASWLTGNVGLGVIGLLAPSALGIPGARAFGNRTASLAVSALILVSLVVLVAYRGRLIWLYRRAREPFLGPLKSDPHFEGAADALALCPDTWHTRWAAAWIQWPGALAAGGVLFAVSCAYFAVDAAATLGRVGWERPVLAAGNGLVSVACFALGARRLSTCRLALSVHREVSGRYFE